MCGIIAISGQNPVAGRLLQGLERLEYRGYDSSGIATLQDGELERVRAPGKLVNLREKLNGHTFSSTCGIGHTRWATHGEPSELNAHPHMTDRVAVVHNGIIENYEPLRKQLVEKGHTFESHTDTEVIAHLLDEYVAQGLSPAEALKSVRKELEGTYAIAALFKDHDDSILVAREGASPLAIGYGEGENYVGSDAMTLSSLSKQVSYLEEGDWAKITPTQVEIYDRYDRAADRPQVESQFSGEEVSKEGYNHFMQKEIYEQPQVVEATLQARMASAESLKPSGVDWNSIDKITFTACGTAFYAGMVAKYWFERIAKLPFDVDVASEFRYRTPPLSEKGLCMIVSQSGETADTLAALEYAKSQGQHILSIVNVPESSIERASDTTLHTLAGPEVGVASTKAFTTQLMVLGTLVLEAALDRRAISPEQYQAYVAELLEVPSLMHRVLGDEAPIKAAAKKLSSAKDTLFLGRGVNFPMALEGALKLKEISYIHAEAYAAGEMKHGPIALIESGYPIVVLAPSDELIDKTASNVQEALARGAWIIAITDDEENFSSCDTLFMPPSSFLQNPFNSAVIVQLLAYHTATYRGTDVDQPRNLAKSVTVE